VQLEGNSFAELISRNTTASGSAADVFSRPDLVLNLGNLGTSGPILDDPTTPDDESTMTDLFRMPDGTIRYTGPLHVIMNGNAAVNRMHASEGDDTLRGNDGNDWMQGSTGNDQHIGGAGDDIILDSFGDDVLKGGPGNDAISAGPGLDLLQGNEGMDWMVGADTDESFGGPGNDFIFAGDGENAAFGDEGDDWIEGGVHLDLLVGDLNNQFQNDPNGGHDVIMGNGGDDDYDAEGGDDIMIADTSGTERFEGMLGYDWVTYRLDSQPVDADLLLSGLTAPNVNEIRDRYDLVEGLSGYRFSDILRGDDRTAADLADGAFGTVPDGNVLNAQGIARITGLAALLPAGATEFRGGNIILGGGGSDLLEGRGGDDIIDGDRWLNVQLQVGAGPQRANRMSELSAAVFAGTINPGNISIVREIVSTFASPLDVDTALFSGASTEYIITENANGSFTIDHQGGIDGVDTLWRVERAQFTDVTITLIEPPDVLVPTLIGLTQEAAEAALQTAGLVLGTVGTATSTTIPQGSVISQTPGAGATLEAGSTVNIVVSLGPPANTAPVAVNNTFTTAANVTLNVVAPGVLGNDTDVDANPLTAQLVAGPAANPLAPGAATFALNANGAVSYSHGVGIAVGASPTPVTFTYRASDGIATSNIATVTINVTRPAGQPVANDDAATTTQNTPITINVDGNDNNGGGGGGALVQASLTVRRAPLNGTAVAVGGADRQITYTPNAGFTGVDTFTYTIADGAAISNVATVTVTVNAAPANVAPVADNDGPYIATGTTPLVVAAAQGVLVGDTDANGDPLTAVLVSGPTPAGGTLVLNANGSFTYTHNVNPAAPTNVTFQYQASDGTLTSNVATVTITVNHANVAPTADNDGPYIATGTTTLTVAAAAGVLVGDTDPEGTALTAVLVSGPTPAGGALTLNANGSFSYTHNVNPAAPTNVTFQYQASDGALTSNTATVTITVNPAPVGACTAAPNAPTNLTLTRVGLNVTLNWLSGGPAGANAPTSYIAEVDTTNPFAGALAAPAVNTGSAATTYSFTVPAAQVGTFFIRVRSSNACGASAGTSNIVSLILP
jgi:hypothetical protein